MSKHHKINYVEFPVKNIGDTKSFFSKVFGWTFIDYGDEYCAVSNAALDAGFYLSNLSMKTEKGSALIILYSANLEESLQKVIEAGGEIVKPIFSFPGGRRFQFYDVNGNEFAVWSE
ncbi:VOC family protein [Aliikangiella sp. IMCC44359]|uniref:VOC family protein n=1 Tax=Aliikangiella sp. IMCC44359 TaxID=3459125 RepID=UPI00403B021D